MIVIFKKLQWFFKKYKKQYIYTFVATTITYGLILVPPYMIGFITDAIVAQTLTLKLLYVNLIILLGSIVLLFITNFTWAYYTFKGSEDVALDTRRMLLRKYLQQSPVFFQANTTGSLMGKVTNDVNAVKDFVGYGVMLLLDAGVYPLVLLGMMGFHVSWKLTVVGFLPMPLLILGSKWIGDKLYTAFYASQQAFDEMNEAVLENISSVRIVRSFQREASENLRFSLQAKKLYDVNITFSRIMALFTPSARLIPGISYLISFLYGSHLISTGEITLGKLISFFVYLGMMTWPMLAVGEYINVAQQANAAWDRIKEVLDYPEEIVERDDPKELWGPIDIEFRNFSFSYPGSQTKALEKLSFSLKGGETLGIVGEIGSGKTTLVKSLLHFYPLDEKSIFLDNIPIEEIRITSLREKIGYVPQEHILFSKTIEENIRMGSSVTGDLEEAVTLSDFTKDLDFLPLGLKTLSGERGMSLSGGQKQRISIARALISKPSILILDDSLSAVDAITEKNILEKLRIHRKGQTTILVAHRLSAVEKADRIIVLEKGRIAEEGTHRELFDLKGWYYHQFIHQQMQGEDHE